MNKWKNIKGLLLEDKTCFWTRGRQKSSFTPDSEQKHIQVWLTSGNAYLTTVKEMEGLNTMTQSQSVEKVSGEFRLTWFTALPGWIQL